MSSAVGASASVPDLWGVLEWEFPEPVHLMVSPDGSGDPFFQATMYGGAPVDATLRIQLWIQDGWDPAAPLVGFPGEDMWLEADGLWNCIGGSSPEGNSDAEGWIEFSLPPRMGGWMDISAQPPALQVMIMGDTLRDENGDLLAPAIAVNSPDINADLEVNLIDLNAFATDFFGAYSFRSDFFWDGVINLADVGRFAGSIGGECP